MPVPLARLVCRAQIGLAAPLVQVEVALACGLPAFSIVGLPAPVVKESRERVRAALLSSGFDFPGGRIIINLAPAEIPKEGGRFELPMALGILIASGQLPGLSREALARCELYGELGLDGAIKPVRGIFLAAAHASRDGHELIIPSANAEEALISAHTPVRAAPCLRAVWAHLTGRATLPVCAPELPSRARVGAGAAAPDLAEVRGQIQAKRALLIAASGHHSLLMIGPPGCGKSMLANRLPGLLPPLTESEALECAAITSVSAAGFHAGAFGRRPFRAPHHTASAVALVGGGAQARPGEVSLAHNGVLFLDELPEFGRRVLEVLREPLEAGIVRVARAAAHADYPAEFQLLAAMNPCPCGHLGDARAPCRCTPAQVSAYRARISGPLLDRIDMHVLVPPLDVAAFADPAAASEASAVAAQRVLRTRNRQLARQGRYNGRLADAQVQSCCVLEPPARALLERAIGELGLSARARQRVLKLARTIADLADAAEIGPAHVGEAVMLRCLDRPEVISSCP